MTSSTPLSAEELRLIHAYWRAANYISVGQIYLLANPLLQEPLKVEHIKPRLLGHWGGAHLPAVWIYRRTLRATLQTQETKLRPG